MLIEVYEFLDGKQFNLNGLNGKFKYVSYMARYPRQEVVHYLHHEPDTSQQVYKERRLEMGDDWITDLSGSNHYIDIAILLGYAYEGDFGNLQTELICNMLKDLIQSGIITQASRSKSEFATYLCDYVRKEYAIYCETKSGLWTFVEKQFPTFIQQEVFNTINWDILVKHF